MSGNTSFIQFLWCPTPKELAEGTSLHYNTYSRADCLTASAGARWLFLMRKCQYAGHQTSTCRGLTQLATTKVITFSISWLISKETTQKRGLWCKRLLNNKVTKRFLHFPNKISHFYATTSFHSAAVGFRQKWKCLKSIFSAIPGPKPIPMRRHHEARNTPYYSHEVFVKLESIRIHQLILWLRTPYSLWCLQKTCSSWILTI